MLSNPTANCWAGMISTFSTKVMFAVLQPSQEEKVQNYDLFSVQFWEQLRIH